MTTITGIPQTQRERWAQANAAPVMQVSLLTGEKIALAWPSAAKHQVRPLSTIERELAYLAGPPEVPTRYSRVADTGEHPKYVEDRPPLERSPRPNPSRTKRYTPPKQRTGEYSLADLRAYDPARDLLAAMPAVPSHGGHEAPVRPKEPGRRGRIGRQVMLVASFVVIVLAGMFAGATVEIASQVQQARPQWDVQVHTQPLTGYSTP